MERADLIVSEVNRQHEIVIRQIGRAEPRPRASAHGGATRQRWRTLLRSEEHTSELQSLMRISYAVFCLKKKTHHHLIHSTLILQTQPDAKTTHKISIQREPE